MAGPAPPLRAPLMSSIDPTNHFRNSVLDLVRAHFTQLGQGLLLSQLGTLLRNQGVDLEVALHGRRLAEALRTDFADELKIVSAVADPKVLRVFPVGVSAPQTAAVTTPDPRAAAAATQRPRVPRIAAGIWIGFVRPVPAGMQRHLLLDALEVEDAPAAESSDGALLILPTDVVGRLPNESIRDHATRVFESISGWLSRNNVDLDKILAKSADRKPARSMLEQLILSLTLEQRKRVELPLDIVEALLKG